MAFNWTIATRFGWAVGVFLAGAVTGRAQSPPGVIPITVTVDTVPRQRFVGLGASLVTDDRSSPAEVAGLTPFQRKLPGELVWKEAGFRILRLWFDPTKYAPTADGKRDPSYFVHAYIDTHRIEDARAAGVTTLLLGPDRVPDYMGDGHGHVTDAGVVAYAGLLAEFLKDMNGRGVRFEAAGILNEPNDRPIKFSDAQWPLVVKAFRNALDGRELKHVAIIAPESANCGDDAYQKVDAIRADPAAWKATAGLATHSYHNCATVEMADRTDGKDYWITEAGGIFDGDESVGDEVQAASVSARFLNDVNHGVTHWVFFIGYELADPAGNTCRIIKYTDNPFDVQVLEKYHYLRQLQRAFDSGAVFRRATSSVDGDMTYKYGPKPRVNAAVARNPDGTWTIGLTNFTSDRLTGPTADPVYRDFPAKDDLGARPSQSFDVTVNVPELRDAADALFRVRRSGGGRTDAVDVPVVMHSGRVRVRITPLQLITLRSTNER